MQICTTGPCSSAARSRWERASRSAKPSPRCEKTRPAVERGGQLVGVHRLREIALEREPAAVDADRCGAGAQRVEQRGGGELGRDVHADLGTEARLGEAGHGRLGDHQDPGALAQAGHRSTRAKSRAVRSVPFTEPETLERVPSARGWYVTSCSANRHSAATARCIISTG